jgi:Dolichyl-phosphate-mannose-protein mannosyltransferase
MSAVKLERGKPRPPRVTAPLVHPPARKPRAGKEMALRRLSPGARAVPYLLLAIAMAFTAWQMSHLHGFTYAVWRGASWSDYDEGVYLASAQQLNNGHAMFAEVFSSQPLLFLSGLAMTLRLAGGSADAGHLYSLFCGLFALSGVAWMSWEIGGRWSALLASVLLTLSPGFVLASHSIEAEAPMLAFGSVAVAASCRYARLGDRRWLVVASFLLAAATLSKLLAIAIAAPILVAVVLKWVEFDRSSGIGPLVRDVALGALCLLLPVLFVFGVFSRSAQWDQVIRFHLKASDLFGRPPLLTGNGDIFKQFLGWDLGIIAMACAGIAVAALLRLTLALVPTIWLLGTFATLVRYHPLFAHHLTVLIPPLAAIGCLVLSCIGRTKIGLTHRVVSTLLCVCAGIVYLIWAPVIVDHDRNMFIADHNPVKARQVAWLRAHSVAGDTVMVDDQMLAVGADRLVPPQLTDTSNVRKISGYLPLSLLIASMSEARVHTVLLTRALMADSEYVAWLRRNFREVHLGADYHAIAFISSTT